MKIIEVDEVDSTQKLAKKLLEEITEDYIVTAKKQTAGYGRRKNQWLSPEGGLWFTLVIRRRKLNLNILPMIIAISVAKALERIIERNIQLKWPNDIYMEYKKVGGILCEVVMFGEEINAILIGIGLNVNIDEIPEEIKGKATSIKIETGKSYDNMRLLREIVDEIYRNLELKIEDVINYWKTKDIMLDKKIRFEYYNEIVEGEVLDIENDGSLKILTDRCQMRIYHWEINNIEILR